MTIYQMTQDSLNLVSETGFETEGIYERQDLQRFLKNQINILDQDLMVIAEEYSDWEDSSRRIDLLCLDRKCSLVVVEIKRTKDGGHMELQALRYAAMVSAMTFNQMIEAHAKYVSPSAPQIDKARSDILGFLKWDAPNEEIFSSADVRIILASANFSTEVTTSVIWLTKYGIDIRCIRMKPYRMSNGTLLLDVQQLIPLPEASDYQTKINVKESEGRKHRDEQLNPQQFFTELLASSNSKTDLFKDKKASDRGWVAIPFCRGHDLAYVAGKYKSRIDLYIYYRTASDLDRDQMNLDAFNKLSSRRDEIEKAFGGSLVWEPLPDKSACRVYVPIEGGYNSPKEDWRGIHDEMVDAMIRLHAALKPHLQPKQ